MDNLTVNADQFGVGFEMLLGEISDEIEAALPKAVKTAAKLGTRRVRKFSDTSFNHFEQKKYPKGWKYKMDRKGRIVTGEIGNSVVPGLPHLLEKGHARVGGGRVEGREHISKAAEQAFAVLEKEVRKAVDRSL